MASLSVSQLHPIKSLCSRGMGLSKPPWTASFMSERFLKSGESGRCHSRVWTVLDKQMRKSLGERRTLVTADLSFGKSQHHIRSSRHFSASTVCGHALDGSRQLSMECGTACTTRTTATPLTCTSAFSKLRLPSKFPRLNHVTLRGHNTDHTSPSFINPLVELQKFVSVPILSEHQEVFSPSEAEVVKAVSIFSSPRGGPRHAATFVGSFADGSDLPDSSLPEVHTRHVPKKLLMVAHTTKPYDLCS